ncbi:MAG: hypothetical protein Q9208_007373 [Pyrenodesmia sp. 3 TL-2023]
MTVDGTFYRFFSYFAFLIVTFSVTFLSMTISTSAKTPFAQCDDLGMCKLGDGYYVFGESMEEYIGPNVTISYLGTKYDGDFYPGHIELNRPEYLRRLPTAILGMVMSRWSSPEGIDGTSKYFVRGILDPSDGADIGRVYIERPTPDPDTRFKSLLEDPLLAGIPTGLRSEVDPASLIPLPTPTEGCRDLTRCIAIFPVSNGSISDSLVIGSNAVIVRRCFLLWTRTDEHGLPFRRNKFDIFSYVSSGDYVSGTIKDKT